MTDRAPKRRLFTRRRLLGAGAVMVAAIGGGLGIYTLRQPGDALAHYNRLLPYRLDDVRAGAPVPRIFVPRINPPLTDIADPPARKDVFLRILLPLVLVANERHSPQERIPVAMALAQGAIESGWGTARFVAEGNALFGQRTWAEGTPGMAPREADGSFRVRAFATLADSVEAYMRNLNTHPEYTDFRSARDAQFTIGEGPTARALLPHMAAYSEEGRAYITKVRRVIAANKLTDFARARLR